MDEFYRPNMRNALKLKGITIKEAAYSIDLTPEKLYAYFSGTCNLPKEKVEELRGLAPRKLIDCKSIRQFLATYRLMKGLTQYSFSHRLNITSTHYCRHYESGVVLLTMRSFKIVFDQLKITEEEKKHFIQLYLNTYKLEVEI